MPNTWKETSSSDYPPSKPDERKGLLELFPPQDQPQTELARYRLLSPTAAIRVSPFAIGAMSIGDQWTGFMAGAMGQKESEEYLDVYYKADEQSELIIGEWMEKRANRHDIVLATKYTSYGKNRQEGRYPGVGVNRAGNHKKNLRITVEESLARLRTDYIDLLYVHWWDHSTSIPELMQSLNDLVRSGKVLYLGVSDTPAWVVSQANEYARQNGRAQFVIYQGLWNLSVRDIERDILPMCRNNGMSIAPWGVLGQGKFKTPEELKSRAALRGAGQPTETDLKMGKVLQEVADEVGGGVHLAHIAMAWARQMMSNCFPILGGTSIDQLKSNIEGLKVTLSDKQIAKLNDASPFSAGFPTAFFGLDPRLLADQQPVVPLLTTAGVVKYPSWA